MSYRPKTGRMKKTNSDYTVERKRESVFVNTSSGAVTITLEANPKEGKRVMIKKKTDNSNNVTVKRAAGVKIEGTDADYVITDRTPLVIEFDNTNWWIVG